MKIYVAGCSAEVGRCTKAVSQLEALGYEVTSTWHQDVLAEGNANPSDHALRFHYARQDLNQIWRSERAWFLFPPEPFYSHGLMFEAGVWHVSGKHPAVMSGESQRTIFGSLFVERVSDADALEYWREVAAI